eukprot:jgi/Psemu1/46348/gm1.46348_g
MVKRSNKVNKGHICLKWHTATLAQSAQELVKRIDPGYGWKIGVVRDPTANPPPSPPTPEKIGEADILNSLDWLVTPGWFMGIYMQLMTNHCPEWVGNEPTYMEASAAGPDIQLAQSWESPITINSKATWDSQSHKHPRFADANTWADAKTQESSNNMSWNSPLPFNAASPATATTDQLRSVEKAVPVRAEKEKKKRNTTKPHSLGH